MFFQATYLSYSFPSFFSFSYLLTFQPLQNISTGVALRLVFVLNTLTSSCDLRFPAIPAALREISNNKKIAALGEIASICSQTIRKSDNYVNASIPKEKTGALSFFESFILMQRLTVLSVIIHETTAHVMSSFDPLHALGLLVCSTALSERHDAVH